MTFAQKDGHTYGLVMLGSDLDNIYKEASEILDWAFASFADRQLIDTETVLTTAPLNKCRTDSEVELYAAAPLSGYGHADDKVTCTFDLPENLSATVRSGAVLGTATVFLDGYEVGTVDLVTHREYLSDFRTDLKSTLFLMAALVVILIDHGSRRRLAESWPTEPGAETLKLNLIEKAAASQLLFYLITAL